MTGDLVHLQVLDRSGNDVLSDVVRRGFLGKIVEHVLRQPRRYVFGNIPAVVGVGAGFGALECNTKTIVRTRQVGRETQIEEVAGDCSRAANHRGLSVGAGTDYQDLVLTRPVKLLSSSRAWHFKQWRSHHRVHIYMPIHQ